jgi:hypothetical protein
MSEDDEQPEKPEVMRPVLAFTRPDESPSSAPKLPDLKTSKKLLNDIRRMADMIERLILDDKLPDQTKVADVGSCCWVIVNVAASLQRVIGDELNEDLNPRS